MKDAARIRSGAVDPSVTAVDAPAASLYMSSATGKLYRKSDAGLTTNWQLLNFSEFTNDPTGFINEETIVVTYDGPNRQFSLYNTATPTKIEFLLLGKYYTYPASVGVPWIVPTVLGGATPIQHTNADGIYYLRVSGGKGGYTLGQVVFDIVPQLFTDLQIAVAFKNATAQFGMRECHNFMPHEDHEEFHYTNGCYLRAAAVLTGYTLPSTNTAQNMIAVAQITVYDEDLSTSILATPAAVWNVNTYTSGAYTIAYHAGPAGLINFYTTAQVPYISNAAAPATADATPINYTSLVAGTGTLTNVAEDNYVNIFTLALPVTADAESQKFRRIFFTGQRTFTTLAAAQLEVPSQVDFGQLRTALPEMVVTSMISYRKNALGVGAVASSMGQCMLDATATPVVFTGTRASLIGVTGVSPSDHQSLSNRNATGATVADCTHPSYAISTEGVAWTGGGVLSATELTVQSSLDKLSSTFAGTGAVGLVSAAAQNFSGAKSFLALATAVLGLAVTGGVAAAGTLSRATTIWNLGNALTINETGCVIDRVAGGDIAIGGVAAVATSITLGKASATTCTTSVVDTTEATVGGLGALKVSGGIYVTKALFGGSTATFATSVSAPHLICPTGGTAATTKITLSGTTWQFGLDTTVKSSITEAGAAVFATSITSPIHSLNSDSINAGLRFNDAAGTTARWWLGNRQADNYFYVLAAGATDVMNCSPTGAWTFPVSATIGTASGTEAQTIHGYVQIAGHAAGKVGFFGTAAAVQATVADAAVSFRSDTLGNLATDCGSLQTAVNVLIDALQAYGFVKAA
jgi:hypothetical protein